MEALQNPFVGSCGHQLSSLSSQAKSLTSTRPSSFTPLPCAALLSSDRSLQSYTFNANIKVPTKEIYTARRAESHRKRALILMRNNASAGYAAALAEIGQSKDILDLIHADLKKLGTFLQHKQLHGFLLNPSIQDTHKQKILARLAEDAAFVPYTRKVLNLIIEKKRAALLKDMVKEFEVIYNQIASTEVALVLLVTEMDPAQLTRINKNIPNMPAGSMDATDRSCLMGYIIKDTKTTLV